MALGCGALFLVAGCSDETPSKTAESAPAAQTKSRVSFDHSHGSDVTDLVKHEFEHQFADQCVEREIKNSVNKELDRKRFEKPCLCIATYLLKDLTAKEAELFIKENKNTQSLRIKFESAAYHCLQEKTQPKGPQLFGKH
ncbi:MAG: hypothetical protein Kow0065_09110 [Methylomicrobium sp.]